MIDSLTTQADENRFLQTSQRAHSIVLSSLLTQSPDELSQDLFYVTRYVGWSPFVIDQIGLIAAR
jgi:hypothetical protein